MKHTNIPGNDLKRIHDYDVHDETQKYLARHREKFALEKKVKLHQSNQKSV